MAANVFGILTAIALALAGFVAYKNQAAYETEISNKNQEKEKLAASEARYKLAKDNLAATITERKGVDEEVDQLLGNEASQKKANEGYKTDIQAKTEKSTANKERLDGIRDKTAKIGDLKELASRMRATNSELEELAQNITSTDAQLANLTAQNTNTEAQNKAIKDKFESYNRSESLPTVNTRIRSIYPAWGFVTLAAGNSGGVVTNSSLDVVRGDTTIAKLMVTSVERNSASASIVPDSVVADVTLMVGDRVIPSKKQALPAKN